MFSTLVYFGFCLISSLFLCYLIPPEKSEDPWNIISREELVNGVACKAFGIKASFPYSPDHTYTVNADDIFLAVKTTYKNENRSALIFKTWYQYSSKETYIVTDTATPMMKEQFGTNVIETQCSHSYRGEGGLQCKTKQEYEMFIYTSKSKWFCNLDDDMYINVPRLAELLRCFSPHEDWYIGSISKPFRMFPLADGIERKYLFGHGQLYCMSRSTIVKILTIFGTVPFHKLNSLYDDLIIGFVNELVLNNKLTFIKLIYHHGLDQSVLNEGHLPYVVSFSYSFRRNTFVNVSGFPIFDDPTRILSAHCHLYPDLKNCPKQYFPRSV